MPTTTLPLFPLGSVLYPGLVLPLHVFEPRYRALVRDLLDLPEGPQRRFGVVAIRAGSEVGTDSATSLCEVGCVAEVREVDPHPDGRYDLVATGAARFRLHGVDRARPYLQGEVELVDEVDGDSPGALAPGVARLFADYRAQLLSGSRGGTVLPDLPDDPGVLSYLVAAALVLDVADKQRLLEVPDTADRLRTEIAVMRREIGILRAVPSVPAVELLRAATSAN